MAQLGGELVATEHSTTGGSSRELGRLGAGGGEAERIGATDVAVSREHDLVLVATCCEPASGTIVAVDLGRRAPQRRPVSLDQGHRGELARVLGLARADTFGVTEVQPRFPQRAGRYLDPRAGATDVAIAPRGGRVAFLIDPARVRAFAPTADVRPEAQVGIQLLAHARSWPARFLSLTGAYCEIVHLSNNRIGLLRGAFDPGAPLDCTGLTLDVLQLPGGQLAEAVLRFAVPIRHVSADARGEYLLLVRADGDVHWRDLAGRGGVLDDRGVVQAADW